METERDLIRDSYLEETRNSDLTDGKAADDVSGEINKGKKILDDRLLKKTKAEVESTGLIYISRLPPFILPNQIRYLLSTYGEIGRIYLAPEAEVHAMRRKKYKRDRRPNYVEGWVEFASRKTAKIVAKHLNGKNMTTNKKSRFRDDLWTIKYLPGFKWNQLTEQISYEQNMRQQKLRAEVSQARRENAMYIKNVEKFKALSAIIERNKKNTDSAEGSSKPLKVVRNFRQIKPISEERIDTSEKEGSKISAVFKALLD